MAAPRKFTDEALKQYLDMGFSQQEIARLLHVSEMAISKRVATLEKKSAPKNIEVVTQAQASVWDTKKALEENYARCIQLLSDDDTDRLKVAAEIRNHLKLAMDVMSLLYSVQETQAFMDEVLAIIDDVEPGARETILSRLRERRTVRAAFLPL